MRWTGRKSVVDSVVTIDLDEEERIAKVEDKWGGGEQPGRFGLTVCDRRIQRLRWWVLISTIDAQKAQCEDYAVACVGAEAEQGGRPCTEEGTCVKMAV